MYRQTFSLNCFIDKLTACPVHREHIEVYAADLGIEVGSYRAACRYVRLHDVTNNLDNVCILQACWILICLSNNVIPLQSDISTDSVLRSGV